MYLYLTMLYRINDLICECTLCLYTDKLDDLTTRNLIITYTSDFVIGYAWFDIINIKIFLLFDVCDKPTNILSDVNLLPTNRMTFHLYYSMHGFVLRRFDRVMIYIDNLQLMLITMALAKVLKI